MVPSAPPPNHTSERPHWPSRPHRGGVTVIARRNHRRLSDDHKLEDVDDGDDSGTDAGGGGEHASTDPSVVAATAVATAAAAAAIAHVATPLRLRQYDRCTVIYEEFSASPAAFAKPLGGFLIGPPPPPASQYALSVATAAAATAAAAAAAGGARAADAAAAAAAAAAATRAELGEHGGGGSATALAEESEESVLAHGIAHGHRFGVRGAAAQELVLELRARLESNVVDEHVAHGSGGTLAEDEVDGLRRYFGYTAAIGGVGAANTLAGNSVRAVNGGNGGGAAGNSGSGAGETTTTSASSTNNNANSANSAVAVALDESEWAEIADPRMRLAPDFSSELHDDHFAFHPAV